MPHVQPAEILTLEEARALQERLGEPLRPGLSPTELDDVESQFGFRFSLDHRVFLTAGVPVGDRWPDWLHGNPDHLRKRLDWPVDGLLYAIEHNGFWHDSWGARPRVMSNALACARRLLAAVPQLVPVCGHRYLPGVAGEAGYPVLSVYQADVAVCGRDLRGYVRREFGGEPVEDSGGGLGLSGAPLGSVSATSPSAGVLGDEPVGGVREVEFWSELVD
ncbi:hypothetical protein [Amycolatopsis sp. NPDC001319]|uniref:hypothetical protein n=1 Tax=unclassified Amycolatopsis TaxID=2618356 RepID=UPI0036780761